MWTHEQSISIFGVTRRCDDYGNGTGYGFEFSETGGDGCGDGMDIEDRHHPDWEMFDGSGWGGGIVDSAQFRIGDGGGTPRMVDVDDASTDDPVNASGTGY